DVIVAANVLHATFDLSQAIANLKTILASNGLLILREITESAPVMGFEITFGCLLEPLLDTDLRNNHPFLSCPSWENLLKAHGFDRVAAYPDPSDLAFDEHIIIARNETCASRLAFSRPKSSKASEDSISNQANIIHPLLGVKIASPLDTIEYQSKLSVKRFPYLGQHRVFDLVVVPATAHFEIAAASGLDYFGSSSVILENTVLREALMLTEADLTLQVVLTPQTSGCQYQIFSQTANREPWHLHVSGNILKGPDVSREKIDLKGILDSLSQNSLTQQVDVASYYEQFSQYGAVQYGKSFQGLRRLWRHDGGAIAEVALDNKDNQDNQYNIHPALLDSCLQSMVAALATNQDDLSGEGFMPFSVDKVIFYAKAPQTVYVQAKIKEGHSFNQDMFSASFKIYDPQGLLIAQIIDLNMKKTNRQTLETLKASRDQFSDLLYETAWREISPPQELDKVDSGSWLILADKGANFGQKLSECLESLKSSESTEGQEGLGIKTQLVTYQQSASEDIEAICLDKSDDYLRALESWRDSGRPKGLIFLWGLDSHEIDSHDIDSHSLDSHDLDRQASKAIEDFKNKVPKAFLYLLKAIDQSGLKDIRLAIMTCGAHAVKATEIPQPTQRLLWGFEQSVASELQNIRPLIIDLDPLGDLAENLPIISNLLLTNTLSEDKLALRGGRLYVPRLVAANLPGPEKSRRLKIEAAAQAFKLEVSQSGLENIRLAALERQLPGNGQVEIQVEATSLNFKDLMIVLGLSPLKDGNVGTDCAGYISALGPDVTSFKIGDRVFATAYGALASHVVTSEKSAAIMPANLSFTQAASIPTVFMTAYHSLLNVGGLTKGQRVLLHSAAGGVGLAAIEVAKSVGAEIYATAGSERKRAMLRSLGVKGVYSSRSINYADQLLQDTHGQGVDIVLNFLTNQLADSGFKCLKSGGRFLEIGRTYIRSEEQIANIRSDVTYHVIDLERMGYEESDKLIEVFGRVMEGFERGIFRPIKSRVFPMEDIVSAFRYMMEARHIGKVVVTSPDSLSTSPGASLRTSPNSNLQGFYLITGGLSELALALAQHLVDKGARKLWLVARREPKQPEIEAISKLIKNGAEVCLAQVDVTNEEAMTDFWRENILSSKSPLKGVYHLAGLLDDDSLLNLTWPRFDKVLSPKVDGSWILHELTKEMDLECFVMYSSMASIMGTHGQSNYVAANTFLDALACYRRANFWPATSINWGAWSNIGAVARMGIFERIEKQGVDSFKASTALNIVDRLVDTQVPQMAVMKVDWRKMLPILSAGQGASLFSELKGQTIKKAPKEEVVSESGLDEKLRALPMSERVLALTSYLKKEIAGFLRIEVDSVPIDAPLVNLGMDSLISLDLFQRISKDLKIRIAPHEISANPYVAAMAEKFARDLGPDAPAPKKPEAKLALSHLLKVEPDEAHQSFPLSDMQQAYWLGRNSSTLALSGVSCHFYFEAQDAGLNIDRYQQAWNTLIKRHDMLRTVIIDGESQRVCPKTPEYVIVRHDLSELSTTARQARLLEIRDRLSHEILDVGSWPTFRVEASQLGGGVIRLHFSF
ncbi:MAG: SDR family NAD(P)-dependent oxidoreductase, partial [Deltaproteobacteria bacterium]|nr:SDR family NAD(P)-dependent oxidoreductase [Deltaproteobacteria bacterium]